MIKQFALTLESILARNHFQSAKVLSGYNGLDRIVKWVHVFEVTEVRGNLKGDELILSTGFGWKGNDSLFMSLLEQLIKRKVAGVCIELGRFITTIPEEAIKLAELHNFPIIVFEKEVPFVEITQDIHSELINQQYEMITNLENYSQRLNKKLLSIDNYFEILKYLQQYLHCQLIYKTHDNKIVFIPATREEEQEKVLAHIEQHDDTKSNRTLQQKVQIYEKEFANIYLVSESREFGEFESLLLDRTATAVAQYLLRELYTEEKKKAEESEWMLEWLQGEHSLDVIKEHLAAYKINGSESGGIVLILKINMLEGTSLNIDITYLNMLIQNIFDQNGFLVLPVEKRNLLIFTLINKQGEKDWKIRVRKGIQRLGNIDLLQSRHISSHQIAGGKYIKKLNHLYESFNTAKETLRIQAKLPKDNFKYFYEDMHMYRLISLVHKHSDLHSLVNEYLNPIIRYDEKNNANLMETLKVYLASNGSKKETAEKIYVVRQTLYHRLEKLEALLGKDFMESEKRQVIEFTILAHEYLLAINH